MLNTEEALLRGEYTVIRSLIRVLEMEFLGFFDCWNDYEEDYTKQAFMWNDKTGDSEVIGVSFRGTSPFNSKDWSSDVDLSWYHFLGIGKGIQGMEDAYFEQ